MGRAILNKMLPKQEAEKRSKVDELERVLMHLHPSSQSIRTKLESFLDEAISLANKMTAEYAWFRCTIVNSGDEFDERSMCVPVEQTGRVLMCTFPSFKRVVLHPETGAPITQTVVPPTVELESHFR